MHRAGRRQLAAVLLLITTVLPACTPPGLTENTGPHETTLSGTFGGEHHEFGCAWLQTPEKRVEVVYPMGWHVEFDPARLFDGDGRQVAKEGDTIVVDGYYNEVGASVCSSEPSFVATGVRVAP